MTLRILVDMSLSPGWAPALRRGGWTAVHWSTVGDQGATDREIMDWALAHHHIVFTHDLDFGTMLALSHSTGPSVIQVRTRDVLPDDLEGTVVAAIRQLETELAAGALVVVEPDRNRVRILPL